MAFLPEHEREISADTPVLSTRERWALVARLADLSDKTVIPIEVEGHALLIVRNGAEVTACQRQCPHEYVDLRPGRVANGRLFCPRHNASFNLCDGASGNGWDLDPLKLYPIHVEEGQVWVDAAAVAAAPPYRVRRL